MATALCSLRRASFKEESVGRCRVYLWMDLEMNKVKKLEAEIQKLREEIEQLRKDLLAISLRTSIFIPCVVPSPILAPSPNTQPMRPNRPYIGDPIPLYGPTITCGSSLQAQSLKA